MTLHFHWLRVPLAASKCEIIVSELKGDAIALIAAALEKL